MNTKELERLSNIGAQDENNGIAPQSIITTIVASVMYCSPAVSTITTVVSVSLGVTSAWSCVGNQCD